MARQMIVISFIVLAVCCWTASASISRLHRNAKMRFCGLKLVNIVNDVCSNPDMDCSNVGPSDFKKHFPKGIAYGCCAKACGLVDLTVHCCTQKMMLTGEIKEVEEPTHPIKPATKPRHISLDSSDSSDLDLHPKKVHHTERDRYELIDY